LNNKPTKNLTILILVAALGYFVDIYDLLLFLIIKNKSLAAIGVPAEDIASVGLYLMNWQMAGLLIGGIFWGILGDKKGRLSVLFGSIILYSLANIANGFVQNVPTYAILRFVAGIGLAGELGAGITLVSETMSAKNRGYGTMIIASVGLTGAVAAYFISNIFEWRTTFFIGGGLGLLLLFLRFNVVESILFNKIENSNAKKGNFIQLFSPVSRFKKYLYCILIAVPVWFIVGILIGLAPQFGKLLGMVGTPDTGRGIMFAYIGIALGDLLTGFLSQYFKTRKGIVYAFILLSYLGILFFLLSNQMTVSGFYRLCFYFGISTGYWVVFVTIASEQFGTNLRATVTTSVPNFVRGSLIPVSALFTFIAQYIGLINSALLVGTFLIIIAFYALYNLPETYGKNLDYVEE